MRALAAPGADVLADFLLVLLSTVPSAKEVGGPPQRLEAPPPVPRSTAAHPRAFRGTTHKPPKPPESVKGDLRPLLGAPSSTRSLLSCALALKGVVIQAAAATRSRKKPPCQVGRVHEPTADPYMAFHHPDAPSRAALPPEFVERLLPSMSGERWEVVRRAAALHQRLSLSNDEHLSFLAARALHASRQNALPWLEVLEAQPRDRWLSFLALVLETGVLQCGARLRRTCRQTWLGPQRTSTSAGST